MMWLSYNAQWVLISTLLLGIAAGVVGVISYWKRESLMSDTIAHATLPGVVIGFLIAGTKQLPILLLGAAITGLLGVLFVQWVCSYSKIKSDAAMGIVLSVFFGMGIVLLTYANRMPSGGQSGLNQFIFGQAASMIRSDVILLTILAVLVVISVTIIFKEWKVYLFDSSYAQGLGISIIGMNALYLVLLVLVIVIGIQAVGVIMIAALMIIPAVSARYWSNSFAGTLFIAGSIGGISGVIGTILSTLGNGWPTGPFIVVTATTFFIISLLFGTSKGLILNIVNRKRALTINSSERFIEEVIK